MANILFTVIPAAGHMNPTVPIAQALQARGHTVRYITGLSKIPMLARAGLTAVPILRGQADTPEQISHPVGAQEDTYNPVKIFTEIGYFLNLMRAGVQEMEQIIREWRPDLVVTDFSTPIGAALAQRNHLRWVTTTTVPSCIRTHTGTPVFLGGLSRPRHFGHTLRDFGGRQLHELLRVSLTVSLRKRWRELGLQLNLPGGGDGLYSPHAILALAPQELEYPRDWPAQLHWIGPIDWSDAPALDAGLRDFLTTGAPRAFVTFGSEQFAAKELLLRRIANTLDQRGVRTLITGGGAVDLTNLQLPNVRVIKYAPYAGILPLVDLVVHHGGSGITYSTLAAGKPALIIPDGKDQPDNAQKVVEIGAGLRLRQKGASAKQIQTALDCLLHEPTFATQAQQFAKRVEHYRPVAQAVAVIERVLARQ
ncbi:MAG: glycosyltransferase [Caldilineaceae bacterium]